MRVQELRLGEQNNHDGERGAEKEYVSTPKEAKGPSDSPQNATKKNPS
jgi:hypothetical protein